MENLVVALERFFEREGITSERTEFNDVFKLGFAGDNGCFRGHVEVDEADRTVQVRTVAPVRVQKSKRRLVAELLTRINYQLLLGTFEMNMDSGTIICRTSIVLGKSDLHSDVMAHLLYANWHAMDEFFPAMSAVLFGGISPRQSLDRVGQQQSEDRDDTRPGEPLGGRLRNILGDSNN